MEHYKYPETIEDQEIREKQESEEKEALLRFLEDCATSDSLESLEGQEKL